MRIPKFYSKYPKNSMGYDKDAKNYNKRLSSFLWANVKKKNNESSRQLLNRINSLWIKYKVK